MSDSSGCSNSWVRCLSSLDRLFPGTREVGHGNVSCEGGTRGLEQSTLLGYRWPVQLQDTQRNTMISEQWN